jgi:type II secretory pathway component PulM
VQPIPLDFDILLRVGGLLVALAVGWGALQAQSKATERRLDAFQQEFRATLEAVRQEATTNRQLAQEALRQAQAAHARADIITTSVQRQEVSIATLAERIELRHIRRTQPIQIVEDE